MANKLVILSLLTLYACLQRNNYNEFKPLPKNINIEEKKSEMLKVHLERPMLLTRTNSKISVFSSDINVLQIRSFFYQAAGSHYDSGPIFHASSIDLRAIKTGQADLIITTEMTVQDTLRQFSDTIHVTVTPEIES